MVRCNQRNEYDTEVFTVLLHYIKDYSKYSDEGDWGVNKIEEVWYIGM